jgi:dTDP-4-dehydrorhamnose reductase
MSKYLLTGGTGKLGTELQKHLDCYAPPRDEMDIGDIFSLTKCCRAGLYDGVIHCAAFTDVPGAEVKRQEAILTNIIGTRSIAMTFSESRIVYISTDYVYSGTAGWYKETDKEYPFNFYGFTKLGGEAFMDPDKDLIIRTSFKPVGSWPYPKAFMDLYTSADYVDVIAKKIATLIKSNMTGIINVGTERKSIYDLAKRRTPAIEPMSVKDVKTVKMPKDISMDLTKFLAFKKQLGENNV